MQLSTSLTELMSHGIPITKFNCTFGSKEKYLWASNNELRWSENADAKQSYSKISIDQILAMQTQDKSGDHLLVIETTQKTYRFGFKSSQIREKWHGGINQIVINTSCLNSSISRSAKKRNTILGENNKRSETPRYKKKKKINVV